MTSDSYGLSMKSVMKQHKCCQIYELLLVNIFIIMILPELSILWHD